MLRWFFDAKDASPLEILSVVPPETFSADAGDALPETILLSESRGIAPLAVSSDDSELGEGVLRWRRVVLNLSDEFSRAAKRHPHLAPIFMEAMGNLLEQLLLFGREEDIIALDEWLSFHPPTP